MSIAQEITRIKKAKTDIATSITKKGVAVPDETKIDGYSELIDAIPTGGGLLQSKTVSPTKEQIKVTPDSEYYGLSDVTVEAIPDQFQDVSDVTATSETVLANKSYVNTDGLQIGTMPNNGDVSAEIDGVNNTSVTIPEGYTSGGTVTYTGSGDGGGSGINPEWTNWAYFSNGNNRNDLVAKLKYDDTANGKTFTSMIEGCSELTELPAINTAKGTNFGGMCKGCTGLVTIGGINVSGVKIAALLIDIFSNCTSLKYVTFEGEFPIKSNIDVFSTCPNLDETTLTHFLSVLANKTTSTKTVSIGSANLVKLTDEQINDVLTNKNIALA